MTTALIIAIIVVVLAVALFGYLAWRDRQRIPSADESAASRTATATAERYAAERHAAQGATTQRNQYGGPQ